MIRVNMKLASILNKFKYTPKSDTGHSYRIIYEDGDPGDCEDVAISVWHRFYDRNPFRLWWGILWGRAQLYFAWTHGGTQKHAVGYDPVSQLYFDNLIMGLRTKAEYKRQGIGITSRINRFYILWMMTVPLIRDVFVWIRRKISKR